MSEHIESLAASCGAHLISEPIQPSARGLGSLIGRIVDWVKPLAPTIDKETVTAAALMAWDKTIAVINFPQVPDAIEVPLKAALRAQIPNLIALFYA